MKVGYTEIYKGYVIRLGLVHDKGHYFLVYRNGEVVNQTSYFTSYCIPKELSVVVTFIDEGII